MITEIPTSLKGQLIIALPVLTDPNFSKTVTCISEHNTEGALGLVINRVHPSLTAADIFDELRLPYLPEAGEKPAYLGGPVHTNEIFMLHGPPFDWEGCFKIAPWLAMSTTRDVLSAAAMGEGPESLLIVLGCAGWAPGQIEMELQQNVWLTSPASQRIIFDLPVDVRWEVATEETGVDVSRLSGSVGHA